MIRYHEAKKSQNNKQEIIVITGQIENQKIKKLR